MKQARVTTYDVKERHLYVDLTDFNLDPTDDVMTFVIHLELPSGRSKTVKVDAGQFIPTIFP